MAKRYYEVGEIVWDLKSKKTMKIHEINLPDKEVLLEQADKLKGVSNMLHREKRKLWEIDKYRKDILSFAKVEEGSDAVIPSKRKEDGAFDLYACLKPRMTEEGQVKELFVEKGTVGKIPTGIASSMSNKYALSLKHERSSIAKLGVSVLAGLVDSGFQGEIQVMISPLVKDFLITDQVDEVIETNDLILYPMSKAIAQIVLLTVPDVEVREISYEELTSRKTERGTGGWGSTNK